MHSPNSNRNNHQSYLILLSLVLCICFLISLEYFYNHSSDRLLVTEAQTVSLTQPASAPLPATPSPEPSPTEPPIAQAMIPNDPYPELYGDNPEQIFQSPEEKVVYLTFDDGPTTSTPLLLEVLKEENVQATFFVIGKSPYKRELLKRIYDENHALGVHTLTHEYKTVYQDFDSYLADFCLEYYQVWEATGHRPRIFRFPGGSVNSHNKHLYRDLIWEMERRGFVYFDWNVTSEDAVGTEDPDQQLQELISQSENKSRIIALLHDTTQNPDIGLVVRDYIRHMRQAGYEFRALDSTVLPIHFPYEP